MRRGLPGKTYDTPRGASKPTWPDENGQAVQSTKTDAQIVPISSLRKLLNADIRWLVTNASSVEWNRVKELREVLV